MGKYDSENLNAEKNFGGWKQYGATKLMNILFTKALVDRYAEHNLHAYAVHPGVVKTNFGANNSGLLKYFSWLPFLKTPEQGAATSIYLATKPAEELKNGYYYKNKKPSSVSEEALNKESAKDLWEQSTRILAEKGIV
jgi:NAD(P)-dependent dehydrogenase (short-subunit alcohol dehydrogenase family)